MSYTDTITVRDAFENNLKHVSLSIPKHKITVFTGVSGSGKSSLVLDTIAAQSRRELNDTFPAFVQHYLPKYGRPHVGEIENLPAAIVIDQKKPAPNQRSTVGTYTDTYTMLRLLFSRVGEPFVGYSDVFSFNHPLGCCPRCDGLGEVNELDVHKLVDFDKCLNDPGVIHYVAFEPGQWRWVRYANTGFFDLNKKIKDYTPEELELFLYSPQIKVPNPVPDWPKSAKYEGLVTRMYRSVLKSDEGKLHKGMLDTMTHQGICPDCGGTRLNEKVRSCRINGMSITDAASLPLTDLLAWVKTLDQPLAADIRRTLESRLSSLVEIGLGYLSLDRGLGTLSGGEAQRCKISKYLNSPLSDLLYILDEPSVGLHSHDIERMRKAIRRLRDTGNTVLLVEHHREMIEAADYIVDMGPEAGSRGGQVMFQGTLAELLTSDTSTGRALRTQAPFKETPRQVESHYHLDHVTLHNLKDISVDLPLGALTVVAGVAGSGKSSLMEAFANQVSEGGATDTKGNKLPELVPIQQRSIGSSLRSTPATYLKIADEIRKIFAKYCGSRASMFSFNGEGKCPVCGGKGVIVSDMAFMDDIETVCEACGGLRYSDEALSFSVEGRNIAEVMDFSCDHAADFFEAMKDFGKNSKHTTADPSDAAKNADPSDSAKTPELTDSAKKMIRTSARKILAQLKPIQRVGLGYLHLNQALSTLSGGELQRIKLASCLTEDAEGPRIYILDEPTNGLHLQDTARLMHLLNELVDKGDTVFLIEHSLDVIRQADYAIEVGPNGGSAGGQLLYVGTPKGMQDCEASITGPYL